MHSHIQMTGICRESYKVADAAVEEADAAVEE
jgi:hypothetical protein